MGEARRVLRASRTLPGVAPYSLADYWLTSVHVGLLSVLGRHPKEALARIVNPLSYPRMMEYALVHDLLGPFSGKKILDVGSPKLPVLLIARDPTVELHATDLRDYFIRPTAHFLARCGAGARLGSAVHLASADARALEYPADEFDMVYSVSVIEHIPDAGDTEALRELARVLKPGGRACITVPFDASGYREEWVRSDVYERRFSGSHVFYQRHYDDETLRSRLVDPSGLRLERLVYFGEPGFQFERHWNRIPMKWKLPLLWVQPFLAKLWFKRLEPKNCIVAAGVCILLAKPGGPSDPHNAFATKREPIYNDGSSQNELSFSGVK